MVTGCLESKEPEPECSLGKDDWLTNMLMPRRCVPQPQDIMKATRLGLKVHFFLLENNCFAMLCQFLQYDQINQPFDKEPPIDGKESACNTDDQDSIPGLGRSLGEEHENPLQYFCLGNPMDRGAWQATVHRVAESDMTWLLGSVFYMI